MAIRTLTTTLLIMGFLSFLFGCSKKDAAPKFAQLTADDSTRLEQQRAAVAKVAQQRYGTSVLTKTKADLPVLQRILDDQVFTKTQTYELQSLGVVFGDVLASELPLHWMRVTDEYGTDLTLRFKDTTLRINALTIISKRVERGEAVDVSAILEMTRQQLAQLGGRTD